MTREENEWIEVLYKKEFERLYRVAYRMTGNVESVQELVQETFALALFRGKALRYSPSLRGKLTSTPSTTISARSSATVMSGVSSAKAEGTSVTHRAIAASTEQMRFIGLHP